MLTAYRDIFAERGAKGFAAAGFVARLPIAMAPIGIVAMVSQTHGAYGLAGAVAATFTLANALLSPQISRLVDGRGQATVLAPATFVAVVAFSLLIAAAHGKWPTWTLFLFALSAAVMPSIPAMVRARWTQLFRNRPELRTAFAFESVADELVYILGASASVGLSVALFPEAGVLVSTLALALGSTAFLLQRATEPRLVPESKAPRAYAISLGSVRVVAVAMMFVGAIFASAEVSTIAITKAMGKPDAATIVIGVYGIGSFLVGIAFGAMKVTLAPPRLLAIATAILAVATLPLSFANTVPLLAIAIFVSGLAVSPAFITAFGLIERSVPPAMLTEGITWVMTGIGMGMALGSAASGWAVDTFGAHNGFWVATLSGVLAFATILLGQSVLGERKEHETREATACAAG